jgi:uncharacterized membrane protein
MMLGAFLAFGVDTIVIVGVLWYVGRISAETAGVVSAAVLVVFALWGFTRWVRLRRAGHLDSDDVVRTEGRDQRDPLEQLKQRYAEGEISDADFEEQLDTLLDADRRTESSESEPTPVFNDRERE